MNKLKVIAAAGIILPVLTAIAAPTAAAAPAKITCTSTTGSEVCFDSGGDYFYVYDTKEDGHHASATWRTSDGRTGICNNYNGYLSERSCNYNFREGGTVYFRAQTREGDTAVHSSELAHATI